VENFNTKFMIKYLFGLQPEGKSNKSDTVRYPGNVASEINFEMFIVLLRKNEGENHFGYLDLLVVIYNRNSFIVIEKHAPYI
jgi:hypothetical protein